MEVTNSGLTFGIYPFAAAGSPDGAASGPPDDFDEIGRAIMELAGDKSLMLRTYVVFNGPGASAAILNQIAAFMAIPIAWDLALCFQDGGSDLGEWPALIREIVRRWGSQLAALQITNEPNLTHPPGDGVMPNVLEALVRGVIVAKEEARATGATVKIGFNAVPTVSTKFWRNLKTLGGTEFADAVDYVGYNIYPDVFFRRMELEDVPTAVHGMLLQLRTVDMAEAGIPATVPIRITENGWPTGPGRSEGQQAEVLETVIRTVHSARDEWNVTHYELFGLRDADSGRDDMFHRFGIVRDDYSRKPAFETYRRLIAEL